MAAASATESKLLKRDTMLNDLEDLDPGTLNKVNDFVDDDLLSCFLWAAGENAVAQPGWESPSVNPLKGIPLPPAMPPLPSAAADVKHAEQVNAAGRNSGILRYHPSQGAVLAELAMRRTAISVASRSPLPRFHVPGRRQQH